MIEIFSSAVLHSFGLVIFLFGLQSLIFYPLTVAYEIWKRRKLKSIRPFSGKVSVLVPAYNEERTIRQSVKSILGSDYSPLEIIVINDGSTDGTEERIRDLVYGNRITYINKENGGKASALNRGLSAAGGEIVIFTDADSFFLPDTVTLMVRWFADPDIDAVCGNDAPLDPSTSIQKFLALTTHIGTGFVRRALSVIGCLPIITGNLGALRASTMREVRGFREIWGEDLELTFRLHRNGKKIIFDPAPRVIAECPGTIRALWRQRVRWMRSYLKIAWANRDLFFKKKHAPFSLYLPVNFFNMSIIPIIQLFMVPVIVVAYMSGHFTFSDTADVLTYLGFLIFSSFVVFILLLAWSYLSSALD